MSNGQSSQSSVGWKHMTENHLYVAWRRFPEDSIHPVGLLTRTVAHGTESYRFTYLKNAATLGAG